MRVPSWCDRILFRAPDEGLNQLFYTSVTKYVFSDHKPVTSLFEAKIRKTDPQAKKEVSKNILANLESLKDQVNPLAALSEESLNFKDLKYKEEQFLSLSITNEGDGLLDFHIQRYISKYGDQFKWFAFTPEKGVVRSGETIEVKFRSKIRNKQAHILFLQGDLTDQLLIKTNEKENSTKTFNVSCNYLRGIFGAPLTILNQLTMPEGKSTREQLRGLSYE